MSTLRLKTKRSVPRVQFELFAFVSVHSIEHYLFSVFSSKTIQSHNSNLYARVIILKKLITPLSG